MREETGLVLTSCTVGWDIKNLSSRSAASPGWTVLLRSHSPTYWTDDINDKKKFNYLQNDINVPMTLAKDLWFESRRPYLLQCLSEKLTSNSPTLSDSDILILSLFITTQHKAELGHYIDLHSFPADLP